MVHTQTRLASGIIKNPHFLFSPPASVTSFVIILRKYYSQYLPSKRIDDYHGTCG